MEKKRLTPRQGLMLGAAYLVETTPRTLFAVSAAMIPYWLGCIVYVCATGHADLVPAVLLRVAVFASLAVLGAFLHRLVGNDDQAWHYFMFWKKRGDR